MSEFKSAINLVIYLHLCPTASVVTWPCVHFAVRSIFAAE